MYRKFAVINTFLSMTHVFDRIDMQYCTALPHFNAKYLGVHQI